VHAIIRHLDHRMGTLDDLLSTIDRRCYTADRPASVGQHVRHCLDHIQALLAGHRSVIRYDQRLRGTAIETDPGAAVRCIRACRDRLSTLIDEDGQRPVQVELTVDPHGSSAILTSTLARELVFVTHHAVHHEALIRPLLAELSLGSGFGLAPATLAAARNAGPVSYAAGEIDPCAP
jgi:uncharacterized damage-inducible protein DinB